MSTTAQHFDVIVIGAGPAGSTAATFIAMQGYRVLLLEKEFLPIYKIGESLLPATIHGICSMLGISEEIKQANFVKKLGGTFRWGKKAEPWTFGFSHSTKIPGPTSYAYQVERMKFDMILLENARRKGVDVREGHEVVDIIMEGDRVIGVLYKDQSGERHIALGRYVVDASGHTTTVGRQAGERIYSQFFRNIAIFGYFENGKRLPAPCSGNIFSVAFELGWFWYIPLSATLTSVGAVVGQEHAQVLRQDHEIALMELIGRCEPIKNLLSEATRVKEGPYGAIRVRKDYSYCNTRFWKPGLILIGDAACFIDPVFSSGVHLATYSALLAARSINSCLSKLITEERAFVEFERRYRREYNYFHDFLVAFYDMDQDLEAYYWSARKATGVRQHGSEAFIQLVAGMAGSGEKLFESSEQFVKSGEQLSRLLFPVADTSSDRIAGGEQNAPQSDKFMKELFTELNQIQLQGTMKNIPRYEKPLFEDGLIPSVDGFHWEEPHMSMRTPVRRKATRKA
jgi:halogenation protein CepH